MLLRNDPKCIQTQCNAPKHEFRVQWSGFGAFVSKKSRCDFVPQTFALIAPTDPILYRVSCSNKTIPNSPKHYATHQNMILGSNGVDLVHSLRKIPTWLHCTNFCINCTSSPHFAPSFMQLQNVAKCIQTLCNIPKLESRVQWGGLAALVAKIPDVTSWQELLH